MTGHLVSNPMVVNWKTGTRLILLTSLWLLPATPTEGQAKQPCTPNREPALLVQLNDAETGHPISGYLVAEDGDFQEELEIQGITPTGQLLYGGAFERPGTYTLRVFSLGYEPVVIFHIQVNQNVCHVITQELEVELTPTLSPDMRTRGGRDVAPTQE